MRIKKGCEICQHAQSKSDDYCGLFKDVPEVVCEHFIDRRQRENLPIYEVVIESETVVESD